MKAINLSFLLLFMLSFFACNSDDEEVDTTPSCTQADWVGSYSGTQNCDGDIEDVTVDIKASGDKAVIVEYTLENSSAEFEPLTPNGCDLDYTESEGGISVTVDASIDGDKLTFRDILVFDGDSADCLIVATRK